MTKNNRYPDNVTKRRVNNNDYEEVTKMTNNNRYNSDRNYNGFNRNTEYRNKEEMKMTNNNRYNNERYNDRYNDGYNEERIAKRSDRAREITKAKGRRQNIVIATLAIALVAVVAASFIFFGAMNKNVKSSDTSPTSISVKADKNENKAAAQSPTQAAQQTAKPAAQQTTQSNDQKTTKANDQQTAQSSDQQKNTQTNSGSQSKAQDNAQTEDNIKTINGERVYNDTKRQAPEKTGTPLHYYANGKTSYGFDWTYDTDNANFSIRCNYNFDQQQYDFIIYGVTPGTSHVTLYYNTSDTVKVPVNLTINVDNDLNVTQG